MEDGPFTRRHRSAGLAAVVVVAPHRLEAVALGRVRVDGLDATDRIAELVESTGHLEGIRAVVLDGIAYGGFNLVDLPALARRLARPVLAVTDRPPDLPAIRAALRTYFPSEFRVRWGRVRRAPLRPARGPGGTVYVSTAGVPRDLVGPLLARLVLRGRRPEVLAMAHRIARAAGRPVRPRPTGWTAERRPRPRRSGPNGL